MAGKTVIADISRHLLERIRKAAGEYLAGREQAALISPADKSHDAVLGLYLYRVREERQERAVQQASLHSGRRGKRPVTVSLHYLAFCSQQSQVPMEGLVEHRILGALLQEFGTDPLVSLDEIHDMADGQDEPATIVFANLAIHEIQEIWTGFSQPMRPAVYLCVSPVHIGTGDEAVSRVKEMEEEVTQR